MGSTTKGIEINENTGEITVAQDTYFDHELQPEVIVQVYATDSLGEPIHSVAVDLIIIVKDVNDVPPEISLVCMFR